MGWSRAPLDYVIAEFDRRPGSVGVLANEDEILLGHAPGAHDRQTDAVNRFAKLDDWGDRFRMAKQFGIRLRTNQSDLSGPSKKGLPVTQQLIGPVGEVFSRGIAEIERQVSTNLMGNEGAGDKDVRAGS